MIEGKRVEVTEEVYRAYKQPLWREARNRRNRFRCRDGKGNRCTRNCLECERYLIGIGAQGFDLSIDDMRVDEMEDRNLVVDYRAIEIMKQFGYPVIFDATHSVQKPGGLGFASDGDRQYVVPLAKAACAVGVAALFLEVHQNPKKALSDGANSIDLNMFKHMLDKVIKIDKIVKGLK